MPKPVSLGKVEIHVVGTLKEALDVPEPEVPFRMLVLGDFSGRCNRAIFDPRGAVSKRRLARIDRDNFDDVLAKLDVALNIPTGGAGDPPATIHFAGLDDFHPDGIFERLEIFQTLKETCRNRKFVEPTLSPAPSAETASGLPTGSLLDQMIEETEDRSAGAKRVESSDPWNSFLQRLVQPFLEIGTGPEQAERAATHDAAATGIMQNILHHPDFQHLEGAWRALHFLVHRLESDDAVELYILDLSKTELAMHLRSAEDLQSTAFHELLVEQTIGTPGGIPWAVLIGNYTLDATVDDAVLLERMAWIAKESGAPFISAASAHLLGCDTLYESPDPRDWKRTADPAGSAAFDALRRLPEAIYLGLVLPRFLLRLPFGADTEPIERFGFEEMTPTPNHDDYLWGNPSFACALLLARAFSIYGWNFAPGALQDIDGLPVHVYTDHGEATVKPCAEVLLTLRSVEAILEKGLMPLISIRDRDTIRLGRFQSLAEPTAGIAGRWGKAFDN